MAKEIIYLTAEGYKKLKDELDHMRSVERPAISAAIAEARDKGDLSENAEYDAAREAQGLLEMRIAKLEDTIANARVIDESKIDRSKVQILSKVTLLNHNTKKQMVYTIVAEHEANLREGKLAIGTPIAKALLGHKKGDRVDVEVPAGTIHFEILDINICRRAPRAGPFPQRTAGGRYIRGRGRLFPNRDRMAVPGFSSLFRSPGASGSDEKAVTPRGVTAFRCFPREPEPLRAAPLLFRAPARWALRNGRGVPRI